MKLKDLALRKMKGEARPYKKSDGGGLFIYVKPNGRRFWRQAYRYAGKQNTISLGEYPYVSLAEARDLRDETKQLISDGINPAQQRLDEKIAIKQQTTFEEVFDEWFDIKKDEWSEGHQERLSGRVINNILPYVKNINIKDIDPQMAIRILKQIEKRGALHVAKRVRQDCSRIFRYAVGMGYANNNPFGDLPLDIFKTPQSKNFSYITDPKKIGQLLRDIDEYDGSFEIIYALKIMPHIFIRPSELARMTWDEVDFKNKQIRIKAERTKKRREHIVPMSEQVYDLIKTVYMLNSEKPYVFWSPVGVGSINPESLRLALRRMGYKRDEITTHGFRHMASTRLNEEGYRPDFIELQLAHKDASTVRAIYNKAEHLEERVIMMQGWSNYLDRLKADD